jgi:hypothetical protein
VIQEDHLLRNKKIFVSFKGCRKDFVKSEWMKEMLNWDLFTHPEAREFAKRTSNEEKIRLAQNGSVLWKRKIFIYLF